ncbi:MAG: WD40 repeat domain-containing protein, partial [Gemmataceae bacterium]
LDEPLPPGALLRLGTLRLNLGGSVRSVAFLPDGSRLVACGNSLLPAKMFDVRTGMPVRTFRTARPELGLFVLAHPRGDAVLTAGSSLTLWDLATGMERWRIDRAQAQQAAFVQNGRWVAVIGHDGAIVLHDGATGAEARRIAGPPRTVQKLAGNPARAEVAVTRRSGEVIVLDPGTGDTLWRAQAHSSQTWVVSDTQTPAVAYDPTGTTLATGGADGTLRLWDARTGRPGRVLARGPVACLAVTISAGRVAAAFTDNTIRVYDTATGKELRRWEGGRHIRCLAFSPDGRTLAGGTGERIHVPLWDTRTGERLLKPDGHQASLQSLAYPANGRLVARSYRSGSFAWDTLTGRPTPLAVPPLAWWGEAFAPDGRTIALSEPDGLAVRDVTTGGRRTLLPGGKDHAGSLAYSPDGRRVAGVFDGGKFIAWEVATGKRLLDRNIDPEAAESSGLAFSPEGTGLLYALADGQAYLHDLSRGTDRKVFNLTREASPSGMRWAVAWSPDGDRIAGADGQHVHLWDAVTGTAVLTWDHHHLRFASSAVAFSPDGRLLATMSGSYPGNVVKLWEVRTGLRVREFTGHLSNMRCLAFAPDGRTLATGAADATVLLWDVTGRQGRAPRADLSDCWARLASADAADGHAAAWELAASPAEAAALLAARVKPQRASPTLPRLLGRLDADDFDARTGAEAAILAIGPGAAPAVRRALPGAPLEARRRLERVLAAWRDSADAVRLTRAVMALEKAGEPARPLLRALAGGEPGAALTEDARRALARAR